VGDLVAFVLDDVVVSAATINAPRFEGRVQISGSFDGADVQALAAILGGGALPVVAEPLPDCLPAGCPVPSVAPGASTAP
jgi:preprotein translocase subunit SecD